MNSESLVIRTREQRRREALIAQQAQQDALANPAMLSSQLQQALVHTGIIPSASAQLVLNPDQSRDLDDDENDDDNGNQNDLGDVNAAINTQLEEQDLAAQLHEEQLRLDAEFRNAEQQQNQSQRGNNQQMPSHQGASLARGNDNQHQSDQQSSERQALGSERQVPGQSQMGSQVQQDQLMSVLTQLGEGIRALQVSQIDSQNRRAIGSAFTSHRDVKVQINTFSGTANEDLDQWLNHMEFVAAAKNLVDPALVLTAVTALKKEPADWYYAMKLEDDAKPVGARQLHTWSFFKAAISEAFGYPETYDHYLEKLISLKQRDKIQVYNNEFACLISKFPDMSEAEKRAYYLRGLRYSTQKDVKCKAPKTWQEARQLAVLIEATNSTVKIRQESAFTSSKSLQSGYKKSFQSKNTTTNFGKSSYSSKFKTAASKPDAKKRPEEKQSKKFKWTDDGKPICNKCHKAGHTQSECGAEAAKKQSN